MKLEAIDTFNELVRSKSIRQAAEGLNISPTAVVRQLDKLEHSFGCLLVERNPRGIRLTAEGEVLAASASRVARELQTARQLIDDLRGLRRGRVSIHTNDAAVSAVLAPFLSEFVQAYPAITIEVDISSAQGALDAVANGISHLAVTMFAPRDPRVEVLFRASVPHEPILSPEHPLARHSEIEMHDLIAHPLALPDRSYGVRRAFDTRLHALGLHLEETAFTTPSLEMQFELAISGSAVLILPRMTVKHFLDSGQLIARPLKRRASIESSLELGHAVGQPQTVASLKLRTYLVSFLQRTLTGSHQKSHRVSDPDPVQKTC